MTSAKVWLTATMRSFYVVDLIRRALSLDSRVEQSNVSCPRLTMPALSALTVMLGLASPGLYDVLKELLKERLKFWLTNDSFLPTVSDLNWFGVTSSFGLLADWS
jgi:hypothetical protein